MPTLEFKGKQHIYAHHMSVPVRPLVPDLGKSAPPPSDTRSNHSLGDDDNLIIHGDNLHALKALLPRYAGRVKCIYIDPPYNTGNENWAYNDNVNSPMHKAWQEKNAPIDGEDMERHDKWLNMMWPRLHLLRELLSDDGVIFISIDDNEQHHLRMMMDEVFGAGNFVSTIIWEKKYAPANDAKFFSDNHDFILGFTKARVESKYSRSWHRNLLPRTEKQDRLYKYDDGDGRGAWRTDNLSVKTYMAEYDYSVINPNTGQAFSPPQGRCWRTNKETMGEWIADGMGIFWQERAGCSPAETLLVRSSARYRPSYDMAIFGGRPY